MFSLQYMLWLCLGAYALHMLEEFVFNWRDWAINLLGLPVRWEDFYVTNALVIVLGLVSAEIAPVWPILALGFPALMFVNATFFHVLPFAASRGRFSPGLITAVLLFYPLSIKTAEVAHMDWKGLGLAGLIGAILMAFPIALLKLKSHRYFDQTQQSSGPTHNL